MKVITTWDFVSEEKGFGNDYQPLWTENTKVYENAKCFSGRNLNYPEEG